MTDTATVPAVPPGALATVQSVLHAISLESVEGETMAALAGRRDLAQVFAAIGAQTRRARRALAAS